MLVLYSSPYWYICQTSRMISQHAKCSFGFSEEYLSSQADLKLGGVKLPKLLSFDWLVVGIFILAAKETFVVSDRHSSFRVEHGCKGCNTLPQISWWVWVCSPREPTWQNYISCPGFVFQHFISPHSHCLRAVFSILYHRVASYLGLCRQHRSRR